VIASIGMILGAYYLLWMLQRVVFGPLREPHSHDEGHGANTHAAASHELPVRPIGWHEIAGLTPLMVFIVLIGVYPAPLFDRLRPTVAAIASRFDALDEAEKTPIKYARPVKAELTPTVQPTLPGGKTLTQAEIKGRR